MMSVLMHNKSIVHPSWAVALFTLLLGLPGSSMGSDKIDAATQHPLIRQPDSIRRGIVEAAREPIQPAVCDIRGREAEKELIPMIVIEQPGGVAERVYLHYDKSEVAMRSYAALNLVDPALNWDYCSGTMIGPNVMMSAGHCAGETPDVTFHLYPAAATQIRERFSCEYLVTTWPDMDLQLFWCDPNTDGENPGDKYGYIDFDIVVDWTTSNFDYTASRARLVMDAPVYSNWGNSITSVGGGWHLIYSEGVINRLGYISWHTPNQGIPPAFDYLCGNGACTGGPNDGDNCTSSACGVNCGTGTCDGRPSHGVGGGTNLWCMGGASGSSQLLESTNRIIVGPLSVGASDARGRSSVGIADHLWFGRTDPNLTCVTCCMSCLGVDHFINKTKLSSLGIANPANYYGWVDANDDGLFDVQKDLEALIGENSRDWYWLGFESYRRNVLWTRHPSVTAVLDASHHTTGHASLSTVGLGGSDHIPVLSHGKLNLPPDRFYRVSYMTYVTQQSATPPIRVCLVGTETHCADANPGLGGWPSTVSRIWASPGAVLRFELLPGTELYLTNVSLVEDGAVMDFDSHDRRYAWRNQNTEGRGRIRPNGTNSGTEADWAGVVYRDPSEPSDDDWTLINRQPAIDGGAKYRICFDHRNSTHAPLTGNIQGRVRLRNEFGEIAGTNILFSPSGAWQQTCIPWVYVPTDDNELHFGVRTFASGTSGAYLVDNIHFQRTPPTTVYVDRQNTGPREEGTPAYPYSSVDEGVAAVATGGTVVITGGIYPENIRSGKAVKLMGAAGSVRVGD